MTLTWTPALPLWSVALITAALFGLLVHGSLVLARKRLPPRWIAILAVLRAAIILVFAACLLQPVLSFSRTAREGPPVLVLLDTSKSMAAGSSTGAGSRLAECVQWLEQSGVSAALARHENAAWYAFDSHARTVDPREARALAANGPATHYANSLSEAWEQFRQQHPSGAPAAGGRVLLVSDGNDAGPTDLAEVARRLGLAVDTLAPAPKPPKAEPARLAVAHLQAPRRVLLGAEARVALTLRQGGLAGKPLQLRLKDGDKAIATQPFTFGAEQAEKTVTLTFRPDEAGVKEYALEIEGAPSPAAAPRFSAQVIGGRHEVLFLEDTWRWEFKFLRRIFEDDPSFTLTAFLSRGANAFVQLTEPERRTQVSGLPQSRADLASFDTFVLGSAEPRRWPRGLANGLRQMVEDDGKSLIVIAGPNLRHLLELPGLAALLPVELSPESANPAAGPVALRVTAEGLASQFFAASGSAPAEYWSSLAPVDQIYPALRKKPAATTLVEAAQLAGAAGNLIAIAEHTVGRGRVLFIATDTLWKWQMHSAAAQGPTPYQVFWQQALRALAPIRESNGQVSLNLQPDRSRCEPGQTVTLRAEIQSARSLPRARLQGQVTPPGGKPLPLAFVPDALEPGVSVAGFAPTVPGQHKLTATLYLDDKPAADTLALLDVTPPSTEAAGERINEANLARIARETGGRHLQRADPASWRALTHAETVPVTRPQHLDFWNRSTLLILLSLLLGADWLLRLLRGFA